MTKNHSTQHQSTQHQSRRARATSRSRRRFGTLAAALAMLAAACGGGDDPVAGDATPADVYTANCARCHGGNFEGAFGPALTSLGDWDDAELIDVIANGRNSMPSWGNKLAEEQIADMVLYLRDVAADS